MNDHIAKPTNVNGMFNVLEKWITPAEPTTVQTTTLPLPEAKPADEFFKGKRLPGINLESGLATTQNNSGLYQRLLQRFLETQQDFEQRFKAAHFEKDTDTSIHIAHTLKGVAGNIGAHGIMKAAHSLETACREDKETIDFFLTELIKELKPVFIGLKSLNSVTPFEGTAEKPDTIDSKTVEPLLKKLHFHIVNNNIKSSDMLKELRPCVSGSEYAREIDLINEALKDYDFDKALEALKKLSDALDIPCNA
jgi:two-component system, sensor histidine kinase and response regulator